MVEALGPELWKMFISFIGDAAACLPCLVKLTKLLNSLNQNLLKSSNKKFQLWSYICEIIICSLEDGDLYMKLIKKIKLQSFVFPIKHELTENVVKFSHTLVAVCYYQKHNIRKGRRYITQNDVLYEEDLKKLFQTPIVTIPDVLKRRNLNSNSI